MKQPLNGPGAATVQEQELNQNAADLARSMTYLQSDFSGWMDERFELSLRQKEQIANLPTSFKSTMTEAIAQELLAGHTVAFAKEESNKPEQEDKDVLLSRSQAKSYSFESGDLRESTGLQILIRYR